MRLRHAIAVSIPLLFTSALFAETLPPKLIKNETIRTGRGAKSLLIHPSGKSVYSINLESMSVCEFDRLTARWCAR
jgi:hypothetical protein